MTTGKSTTKAQGRVQRCEKVVEERREDAGSVRCARERPGEREKRLEDGRQYVRKWRRAVRATGKMGRLGERPGFRALRVTAPPVSWAWNGEVRASDALCEAWQGRMRQSLKSNACDANGTELYVAFPAPPPSSIFAILRKTTLGCGCGRDVLGPACDAHVSIVPGAHSRGATTRSQDPFPGTPPTGASADNSNSGELREACRS